MAKNKFSPAGHVWDAKISRSGSLSCATCSNAACDACCCWCRTTFSGLLPIPQSLLPNTAIQLCVLHMQRNPKTHLSKPDSAEFQQPWRAIKASWNLEVAHQQFEQLCQRFAKNYSTFIAELRKKRQPYLAFLQYPEMIRRSLSTTNVVEAINGQLEIMRPNSGGYFHSQDTLKLKLGL